MELFAASRQWAVRPSDERFWSLGDLETALESEVPKAKQAVYNVSQLRAQHDGTNLSLCGPAGVPAHFTNWGFGQFCQEVGAPASYLRTLTPDLATSCLNYNMEQQKKDTQYQLLLRKNGTTMVRAATTPKYARLWNLDVVKALKPALDAGWRVPPARPMDHDPRSRAATIEDILPNQGDFGLSVKVGDMIAPAGIYCGDRDMFCFLVQPDRIINDGGKGLMRGCFVRNSEVRYCSFVVQTFLMENVCGNHIVWGAEELTELRLVHKGKINSRFGNEMVLRLRKYADDGTVQWEQMIKGAKGKEIAPNREQLVEKLFGMKKLELSKKDIEGSFDFAAAWEHTAHAAPTTVWGFTHGLTRFSQTKPFADERHKLDRAGSLILAMAV